MSIGSEQLNVTDCVAKGLRGLKLASPLPGPARLRQGRAQGKLALPLLLLYLFLGQRILSPGLSI